MNPVFENLIKKHNTSKLYGVEVAFPGLIVSETADLAIPEDVDPESVNDVAALVTKEYQDRPFGFRRYYYLKGKQTFIDKGWNYFGGLVRTAKEVLAGTDPREGILRSNVKSNKLKAVVTTRHKQTMEFDPDKDRLI